MHMDGNIYSRVPSSRTLFPLRLMTKSTWNLLQDKATSGKQGLGIKNQPKKVAGCHWKGKKTCFSVSDDEISADSDSSTKRKRTKELDTAMNPEPRTKLKNLCKQLLRQVQT